MADPQRPYQYTPDSFGKVTLKSFHEQDKMKYLQRKHFAFFQKNLPNKIPPTNNYK
jgi:hypothetical protein